MNAATIPQRGELFSRVAENRRRRRTAVFGLRHRSCCFAGVLPERVLEWSENHRNIDYNEGRPHSSPMEPLRQWIILNLPLRKNSALILILAAQNPCGNVSAVDSSKPSRKRIAVIPGDGIGQEVIPQAVNVIRASGANVDLTEFDWGADRYLRDGTTVPPDGFAMLSRDFDAILAGAFGDPRVKTNIHAKEILLGMRFKMDLYANVRPVRLLDAALCPLKNVEPKDVDFVVIRENTEGVYTDAGGVFKQGTPDEIATQEDINTRKGVERIIRYAFEYCERHSTLDGSPRSRVMMCDKSNAMTHAGGLWQRVFKEVSAQYPKIAAQHMYVDALCLQMVRDPRQFDVVVTNNMFGDIITDLAAGLQGGLGMAASGNIHPGKTSMFEPVHGSAPPIAGKNLANPFGAILTAAMMLAHLGFVKESEKIEGAVLKAVRQKKTTQDIGGTLGTREAGKWVADNL
jgi:3-isopropylmalate dehydrogenase